MPNLSTISLPPGARVHHSLRLLCWHPSGLLDAALAAEILRFVDSEEAASNAAFDRYADLSGLRAIRLSTKDIEKIAARRIESYQGGAVKSAILALHPLAFGIAGMYERLMRPSPIEVRVFCRISSAASWLNAPIEVLASAR